MPLHCFIAWLDGSSTTTKQLNSPHQPGLSASWHSHLSLLLPPELLELVMPQLLELHPSELAHLQVPPEVLELQLSELQQSALPQLGYAACLYHHSAPRFSSSVNSLQG